MPALAQDARLKVVEPRFGEADVVVNKAREMQRLDRLASVLERFRVAELFSALI